MIKTMDRIKLDQHQKPEHTLAISELQKLAYRLNQANVSMILMGSVEQNFSRKNQYRVITAQLLSAIGTLHAILRLTEALSLNVREAIALSRIFYETCLVATFTAIDKGHRAERATNYSIYKTFRSQTKAQRAGLHLLRIERHPKIPRRDSTVQAAIKMFENQRNGPCFSESREQMIEEISIVDSVAGLHFGGVEGMIFELSSEIIHGSLYGYEDFNNTSSQPGSAADHFMSHFESVHFSICLSSIAISRVLRKELAPTPQMQRVEKDAFSALKQFVPDETRKDLPEFFG